jgi:hypothetical protein
LLDPVLDDANAGNLAVAEEIGDALAGRFVRKIAKMGGVGRLRRELSGEGGGIPSRIALLKIILALGVGNLRTKVTTTKDGRMAHLDLGCQSHSQSS